MSTLIVPAGEKVRYYLPLASSMWREVKESRLADGLVAYEHRGLGLHVIASLDNLSGQLWLHISVSREKSLPTWDDLKAVKTHFIGAEKEAVQVLPRESEYVNAHPHTLHLWHRVDGETMPK